MYVIFASETLIEFAGGGFGFRVNWSSVDMGTNYQRQAQDQNPQILAC
jgi:hypothetical protein